MGTRCDSATLPDAVKSFFCVARLSLELRPDLCEEGFKTSGKTAALVG
jgi:hypothetical protein